MGDAIEPADAAELDWLGDERTATDELAAIWATVDLERALRDLGLAPDLAGSAVDDPLLGARVLGVDGPGGGARAGGEAGAGRIALAEPSTEGRLAAFLARNGEGPAGRYLGVPLEIAAIVARAAVAGVAVSRPAGGLFGSAVLVLGAQPGSQFLILVEVAAVPSRP